MKGHLPLCLPSPAEKQHCSLTMSAGSPESCSLLLGTSVERVFGPGFFWHSDNVLPCMDKAEQVEVGIGCSPISFLESQKRPAFPCTFPEVRASQHLRNGLNKPSVKTWTIFSVRTLSSFLKAALLHNLHY